MQRKYIGWLIVAAFPAVAQVMPVVPVVQVEVKGEAGDAVQTRDFVAGKILIDRQRIEDSGAQNVSQVLRREPAITVGKNGLVGLMGLPGYTQILLDGSAADGVDPLELDIVHVEKIEIIKSATAVTGPFGIAGTINIVRSKIAPKTITQLKTGVTSTGGRRGGELSWSNYLISKDSPLSYNLNLSANRNTRSRASAFRQVTGSGLSVVEGEGSSLNHNDWLNATSKLAVALDAGHKISVAPELLYVRLATEADNERRGQSGEVQTSRQRSSAPLLAAGLPLEWNWTMDEDSRLSLKWKTGVTHADNDADRWEASRMRLPRQRSLGREIRGLNHFLDAEFNTSFAGGHDLSTGVRLARNRLQNEYADFLDGVPDLSQSLLGASNLSRTARDQWFAQDDWRINKSWSIGAGLNGEHRRYDIEEGPVRSRPSFTVWSPTLHIVHKIGGNSKRQLRLSLARTFLPPSADQMLLRPLINSLAPCYAQRCTVNTFDTADISGNPQLQPERALGLNLSYSHKLATASELGVEVYAREIRNKTGSEIALETVPWADAPRYVSRTVNLGKATLRGLDLTGRLAFSDVWKTAPAVTLSGSLGFAHSEVRDLAGPDNRLAGQLPWRAKVAASYAAARLPLKLNLDANVLPADWTRSSDRLRDYQAHRVTVNANGSWKFSSGPSLVVAVEDIGARAWRSISEYQTHEELLRNYGRSSAHTRLSLKLDFTL